MCKYYFPIFQEMAKTKVIPRKTKEVKFVKVIDCLLCGTEFSNQDDLKNHLLQCVEKKAILSCSVCHKTFKKKAYLNKHLKNTHGQSSSKTPDMVKVVEVEDEKSKEEDTDDGDSNADTDDEDDVDRYDPGELTEIIGDVSQSSEEEDTGEVSSSAEKEDDDKTSDNTKDKSVVVNKGGASAQPRKQVVNEKTEKSGEKKENDKEDGPWVRKKCNPSPVFTPPSKRKEELLRTLERMVEVNNNDQTVVSKETANDQCPGEAIRADNSKVDDNIGQELHRVKRRRLTRIVTRYVEDNRQVEKTEEDEEWFES